MDSVEKATQNSNSVCYKHYQQRRTEMEEVIKGWFIVQGLNDLTIFKAKLFYN